MRRELVEGRGWKARDERRQHHHRKLLITFSASDKQEPSGWSQILPCRNALAIKIGLAGTVFASPEVG
jgi:hypothetical protein